MIRNENASKAISILQFSKRRISNVVEKALRSAIANAENNHSLDIDKLVVKEAYVGKGVSYEAFSCTSKRTRCKNNQTIFSFNYFII